MQEKTDETHYLTMPEIIAELAKYDIEAQRKSIYDDIAALNDYGIEIIKEMHGYKTYYHCVSRDFELAELRLIIDAIASSKFITLKKSKELIEKLEKMVSLYSSRLLFGNVSAEAFRRLDERTVREVFAKVPSFDVSKEALPCGVMDLLAVNTAIFPSKGEARKMIQGGGVSLNKEKVSSIDRQITSDDVINGHYILAQKGKKNYFIINIL